jgi:hypothetical protein
MSGKKAVGKRVKKMTGQVGLPLPSLPLPSIHRALQELKKEQVV